MSAARSNTVSIALAGVLAFLAGCAHEPPARHVQYESHPVAPPNPYVSVAVTNRIDPAWLQPPPELFRLGPGDKVDIEIIGDPGSLATTLVGPDGKIYFDLLPGVDVWGLTLAQAKERIEQGLGKYMREPPRVSVVLREVSSQRVWILGRVQAPGVYTMPGPTTLLEAISMAGGTLSLTSYSDQQAAGVNEELADLGRSFVVRDGKCLPVDFAGLLLRGDMSQNIYLRPDDFVYFPAAAARDVYVLGAVTQPQAVPYHDGLTVAGAIAGAYGTLPDAYLQHVALVEGSLSRPKVTVVDYKGVLRGETPDLAVEPGDIVYVPLSPYRILTHYVDVILDTFVSSAAINAGTRPFGQPNTFGAGIFIPVGSGIQVIPPTAPPPIH